jgi:branched-chain amino acid transport system permease protein
VIIAASASTVIQDVVDALASGSLYALVALGVALVFGIMRLVNFAHGELILIGAYTIVVLSALPIALLLPVMLAVVALAAVLMERVGFRPVRGASAETLMITSFALSFILQNVAILSFGALPRSTAVADGLTSAVRIGGVAVAKVDLVTIGVTFAMLAGLALFLGRTTLGVRMRAAAEDFEMARLLGINANRVIAVAFAIAGLMAAAAAFLLVAGTGSATPTMGSSLILIAFIATVVGGIGSLQGAVLGGFLIGALGTVLQITLPVELRPYRDAFVFVVVIAMLLFRPQGLIVPRTRVERV